MVNFMQLGQNYEFVQNKKDRLSVRNGKEYFHLVTRNRSSNTCVLFKTIR